MLQNLYQVSTNTLKTQRGKYKHSEQSSPLETWEIRSLSLLPASQELPSLEASPKEKYLWRKKIFSNQGDKAIVSTNSVKGYFQEGT